MPEPKPGRLARGDGHDMAYIRTPGKSPGVIFLGGLMSDMTGTKAQALEDFCRRRGNAYLRFDYLGHGESSGRFQDGTIGRWAADAIAALDRLSEGPQVLVGSSMGGWIMLLAALARPARVRALLGIAAAPDFTRRMLSRELSPDQRARLLRDGSVEIPSDYSATPYVITRALIEDGERNALLDRGIALEVPVRLIHGTLDSAVAWQTSLGLMQSLASRDVTLTLVKDGDHRLSTPPDLARIQTLLGELLSD